MLQAAGSKQEAQNISSLEVPLESWTDEHVEAAVKKYLLGIYTEEYDTLEKNLLKLGKRCHAATLAILQSDSHFDRPGDAVQKMILSPRFGV